MHSAGNGELTGWTSRPERPFRAALFVSLVLHLIALALLEFPRDKVDALIGGGQTALTVSLAPGAPPEAPPLPSQFFTDNLHFEFLQPVNSLLPETPAPPPEASAPQPVAQQEKPVEPIPMAEPQPQSAQEAAFIDKREPVTRPGMATVFLRINEEGRVVQIIWDQLPVVSKEELLQMERELRERIYPATGSGYALAETLIVPRARRQGP